MAAHKHVMPAIPEIAGKMPKARDHFMVCDTLGDLCDLPCYKSDDAGGSWYGGKTIGESREACRNGDLSAVPESEKYLDAIESHVFVSRSHRTINDVVGGMVDVPSYLAGVPCHMRRRQRVVNDVAPLSIMVDLTSSAAIDASDLFKRGAAILALVRLLSNLRPVELWALAGIGSDNHAQYTVVKIDTAPLDLARAAHVLTHASVARGLLYGVADQAFGYHGAWPYGADPDLFRQHGETILRRVVSPGSDVLFVPAIHVKDQAVKNPTQWLKDMLHRYGGDVVQNGE